MIARRRSAISAAVLAASLAIATVAPASATIHEIVASFCSGGQSNVFPPGQSDFTKNSLLRALQASGAVTVRPNTPTARAITLDYNDEAPNGKFTGDDVFVEVLPGVWIEILEPDHAAFEHCPKFAFEG